MELISRQQAINAIEAEKIKHGDYLTSSYVGYEMAEKVVKQLPPIQPKKGRWIGKYPVSSICSECGYLINDSKVKVFAFCPNCGAKMEVTT